MGQRSGVVEGGMDRGRKRETQKKGMERGVKEREDENVEQ